MSVSTAAVGDITGLTIAAGATLTTQYVATKFPTGVAAAVPAGAAGTVLTSDGSNVSFQLPSTTQPPLNLITATGQALATNSSNLVTAATATTSTLPVTAAQGSVMWVINPTANTATITIGSGQSVVLLTASYVSSIVLPAGTSLQLFCTTANNVFIITQMSGTPSLS